MLKLRVPIRVLIALGLNLLATQSFADSTCNSAFAKLRDQAARVLNGQKQYVYFLWSTTYAIPDADARFTGEARGQLQLVYDQLVGVAHRVETYYDFGLNTRPQKKVEWMGVRILGNGKMQLELPSFEGRRGETYGPFDPVCSADKFAVIHSGDSVEVFAFVGTGPPLKVLEQLASPQ